MPHTGRPKGQFVALKPYFDLHIKAAYPDSWRDYVLCRAGTEEPIAVVFPHMGRIYYAPTLSMFEKAGPHGRHFGE